jgi:hypothetical protein
MWGKLFRSGRNLKRAVRPMTRVKARLRLEALEDRWLPSTFTWANNVDGNFNDPTKWMDQNHQPGVPGAGDTAIINVNASGINVTIPVSESVFSLSDNAHLVLTSGHSLSVAANSTITGAFDNAGTVNVNGAGVSLVLEGGGAGTGTFNTATGATLEFFVGGTYNWNAGTAFTGNGQVYIAGPVSVNAPLTMGSLRLDSNQPFFSGTITDNANLTITGALNWTGGTIGGTGTTQLTSGSTTTINTADGVNVGAGHTLQNAGTVDWIAGSISLNSSTTVFNNQAGAAFNAQGDASMGGISGATFNNAGTFTKTSPVGTGTTTVSAPAFNNAGTVTVQSGKLTIGAGGAASGAFSVGPGDTLAFIFGGNYTFNAGSSLTGTGLVDVGGTTVNVNGALSVPSLQVDNGSLIANNGSLTITGGLNWTGGTLGGKGITTLAAGSISTINAIGGVHLIDETLQNAGTLNWLAGTITLDSSISLLANLAGGIFNAQADSTLNGSGTLSNAGQFTKTSPVGSGLTTLNGPVFNNTGTLAVQSGALNLATGGTSSGAFTLSTGAILYFGFTSYTVNSGTSFSGGGTPIVDGPLNINGNVSAARFEMDSGTLSGTGNLTTTGTFIWTGGFINETNGHFTIPKGATFDIQGNADKFFYGGTMNLSGTTNWIDSGNINFNNAATISNLNGATFNIRNDQSMSGTGVFNNAGLLTKVGGMAATNIGVGLNNGGRVEVHTSTLNIAGTAQVSGTTLTGGTWSVFGSSTVFSTLSISSVTLNTIGAAAAVTLNGLNTTFTNLSGLNAVAGKFSVLNGQTFTTAGDLTVSGTLTAGSGGTQAVSGNFTLTSTGTLAIQVGGTSTKPTVGKITTAAGKTVTLAGKLAFTVPIKPVVGQAFTILDNLGSSPINGIFAGLPEGSTITVNGMTFQISYAGGTGNDVTLTRIS